MIEIDILKSILLNDEKLAIKTVRKYGLLSVLKLLKKNKIKNNFFRLISSFNTEIKTYSFEEDKKYIQKNNEAKKLSVLLNQNGIKHIFFKGVAISEIYNEFPSDRSYNDFDILIDIKKCREFYNFLDKFKLKHRNNYKYLHRLGYTRTAIEVIRSDNDLVYDFHHRITSKFKFIECPFTKDALNESKCVNNINVPSKENLIAITLHHSLIQNNTEFNAQTFVDIFRLTADGFDEEKVKSLLNKLNLFKKFMYLLGIMKKIKFNNNDLELINFVSNLFKAEEKNKKLLFNLEFLKTQFSHLIDSEPYINYAGGNIKKNHLIELINTKLRRKKIRNL